MVIIIIMIMIKESIKIILENTDTASACIRIPPVHKILLGIMRED